MNILPRFYRAWFPATIAATALLIGSSNAADLNPKAISIQLPKQIKWKDLENGAKTAVVVGDTSKPGMYVALYIWPPHKMSHPHYHPNDRYVTVLSGTWWVGTGSKFDPDSTVPLPPGSFATHFAKQVHYDGAKDEQVMLEIVGEGPATSIDAEVK